jgi:hypothetical protein
MIQVILLEEAVLPDGVDFGVMFTAQGHDFHALMDNFVSICAHSKGYDVV